MQRYIKILYWVIFYVGCVVLFLLMHHNRTSLLVAILVFDLFLWCILSWISRAFQKRERAMLELLNEYQLTAFIEKYSKAHAKDTKTGFSNVAAMNLATAYMHLGDLDTAMQLFRQSNPVDPRQIPKRRQKTVKSSMVTCAVYHNNIACAYLRCHNTEQAKLHMEAAWEYLTQLKEMAKKYPNLEQVAVVILRDLTIRRIEMSLETGEELDAAKELKQLQTWFDNALQQSVKVNNRYLASILYDKCGKQEEAEKCRAYVKQHGGDSCYVKWVEESETVQRNEQI